MKAIQSLVYSFSGINIFAKATASSMNKTAGSASKASKSLAGVHNEINNVSNNNAGGSGTATPSMDLSKVDESMNTWINKWKKNLGKFFEPLKKAWKKEGQSIIKSAGRVFEETKESIISVGESWAVVWSNGTGQETIELILQIFRNMLDIIGNIAEAWNNAWNTDNNGTEVIQTMWNALNKLFELIKVIIEKIEKFTSSPIVQEYFENAIEMTTNFWEVLEGLLDYIIGVFTGDWERAWNGMKNSSSLILDLMWNIINDKLLMIKALITNSTNSVKDIWSNTWRSN